MSPSIAALRDLLASRTAPVLKAFHGGTDRCVSPRETFERIRPHFPMIGITRVADITGLDRLGIPVIVVTRPNSRALAVSQGKGIDLDAAKASGMMESLEAWHAERIDAPLKLATYEEMRWVHSLADLAGLPRDAGSAFHPHLDLLWIEGWDLLRQTATWVPYELVHTRFTLPRPTGSGCFAASSNGLASGNNLIEAICHGICEVIERDAATLLHLQDVEASATTKIDLSTVTDPAALEMLKSCERAEVDVAVWEMTSDVGVPAFYCVIAERVGQSFHQLHSAAGMGCHPRRAIAFLRALTEAAQSRLTIIAGSRDDVSRDDYDAIRSPDVQARERRLVAGPPTRHFEACPDFQSDTFNADLDWLLKRLKNAGIRQVIAVDLTRPGLGIAVVRVVIPGMESASLLDVALGDRARSLRLGGVAGASVGRRGS